MDRLGDSRLSRMLQLALCQELDAVTAYRQYCIVFIGYQYDYTSHFEVRRNCVEVCQLHRSDTSMRALCPRGGCPWSPMTGIDCSLRQLAAFYCLKFRPLLDSGASRTVDLQCGTVCHQPCAKACHWLHLRQY